MSKLFSTITGILLLDKPLGITSNGVLQRVKRLLAVKKAGHTGSLDPLASGMLPICIGSEATKFSSYLLDADKHYEVGVQLGICTSTGDAEGEVISRRDVAGCDLKEINSVLQTFLGEIEQIPPMFSAIKQNGTPLYELARKGIIVPREKRKVHIYDLQLLNKEEDVLTLHVHCSKGTYIRTLAEDIGETLGCGGYVNALRRSGVGNYLASQMISLAELEDLVNAENVDAVRNFILPVPSCLAHLPVISVNSTLLFYLQRGQAVRVRNAPLEGCVKLLTLTGDFVGVGEVVEDGRIGPRRLVRNF